MQRRRHVDAGVVIIGALEAHVLRAQVGADLLEERAEAHAAPFADRAPALDANVARDLRRLRKCVELRQSPRLPVADQPRELQGIGAGIHLADFILAVEGVERKWLGDGAGRIFGREPVRIEEPSLDAVIPARHLRQHDLHTFVLGELAPGEQRERTQAQPLPEEQPSLDQPYLLRSVMVETATHAASFHHRLLMRPVIMLGKVRGTRITMTMCTRAMNTTTDMARKWTRRAPS